MKWPTQMNFYNCNHTYTGTLVSNASGKENGSKYLKHVNLMNLTAIKRVVDITDTGSEAGIFALVCRTNQELKVGAHRRLCKLSH